MVWSFLGLGGLGDGWSGEKFVLYVRGVMGNFSEHSMGVFFPLALLSLLPHCISAGFFLALGHVMTLWQPVFCYIIDRYTLKAYLPTTPAWLAPAHLPTLAHTLLLSINPPTRLDHC